MKYILGLIFALMASGAFALDCREDWFHPGRCYTPTITMPWDVAPQSGPGPQAVQLTDFTPSTIYRQVECEIGRLAPIASSGRDIALRNRSLRAC